MGSLITWSISTEWFFYCLYPIVAWLLAKTQRSLTAALVLTALALLGLVLAVFIYLHDQEVNAFAQAA
jgi:peptidoglycan/LPS O-acetylase OafA/YrhL